MRLLLLRKRVTTDAQVSHDGEGERERYFLEQMVRCNVANRERGGFNGLFHEKSTQTQLGKSVNSDWVRVAVLPVSPSGVVQRMARLCLGWSV